MISEGLKFNRTLTEMNLECDRGNNELWRRVCHEYDAFTANNIGEKGCRLLSEGMEENGALIKVNLMCNNGDEITNIFDQIK